MTTPAPDEQPTAPQGPRALPQQEVEDTLSRIERQRRESLELGSRIDRAWSSAEARSIKEVVENDGNVDWREFVRHCGGILNVVDLVDERGKPDTRRIVPLVDELFAQTAETEYRGGVTFRRHPRNRPYLHERQPKPATVEFPGDYDARAGDADRLLEEERRPRPSTAARR